MEQAQYNNWIWAKRKNDYGDSWEERAFALDAARYVEDYTWPPRSYSCNFCPREFKSAQALGGHMNVHRRDRARLKQSPNPSITNHQPLNPLIPSCFIAQTLPASNIRVPITNVHINENLKSKFSLDDSWSEKICFCANDFEISTGEKGHDQIDKADLSVNFDLVVEYSVSDEEFNNIPIPTCKRRRIVIDHEPSLTLFPKSSPEVMSPSASCNKEELDLELRLGNGDPPEVK